MSDSEKFQKIASLISKYMREQVRLNREIEKRFPPDPPNSKCHHAIIDGLQLSNSVGVFSPDLSNMARTGDVKRLFQFNSEQLYRWTHKQNEYSIFLSTVPVRTRPSGVWRTAATALRLAVAIGSEFEHMPDTRYVWIYHFDRRKPFPEQTVYDSDILRGGQIHPVHFWAENAQVLELLARDERFYLAAQYLYAAFQNHWFCLLCALSSGRRKHEHPEPDIWELSDRLPGMEIAVVQATKAVEGLLGKPGDRGTPQKLERVKARWSSAISLSPDESFIQSGQSFLDYYYALFGIRGVAAHSFGQYSPKMSRMAAVQAQCFAWVILLEYFKKHRTSINESLKRLKYSRLVTKKPEFESVTQLTGDGRESW
jgi:hypothetical protein